jgi:hypothetical protein
MIEKRNDSRWIWGWGAVLTAVVIGLPVAFRGMFGLSDKVSSTQAQLLRRLSR